MREIEGSARGDSLRVAIVAARFNEFITRRLVEGAQRELVALGVADADIVLTWVPGSFEMPLVARELAKGGQVDAVVCLGAVLKGETDHYRHVCDAAAAGTLRAGLDTGVPVAFGVLTCDTLEQAIHRAGAKAGNKGAESARAAVETARTLQAVRALGS